MGPCFTCNSSGCIILAFMTVPTIQLSCACGMRANEIICLMSGHNKNSQKICFWTHLISQKRFTRIDHKYLIHGHTFLPNDRDFAQIEKRGECRAWVMSLKTIFNSENDRRNVLGHWVTYLALYHEEKRPQWVTSTHQQSSLAELWGGWGRWGHNLSTRRILDEVFLQWRRSIRKSQHFQGTSQRCHLLQVWSSQWIRSTPSGHPINPKKVADLQTMIPYLPTIARDF